LGKYFSRIVEETEDPEDVFRILGTSFQKRMPVIVGNWNSNENPLEL